MREYKLKQKELYKITILRPVVRTLEGIVEVITLGDNYGEVGDS